MVSVNANADAWVDQGSAGSNKGTDSILKVKHQNNNAFRTLVRFPMPQLPQGCVVDSAQLRMWAASSVNNRTLQALRVTGSWTENQVTWANQPATAGTAATTTSGSGVMPGSVSRVLGLVRSMGLGFRAGGPRWPGHPQNQAPQFLALPGH